MRRFGRREHLVDMSGVAPGGPVVRRDMIVGVVLCALLAGCSSGVPALSSAPPTSAPSASLAVDPSATPGRTLVSDTGECRLDDIEETFEAEVRTSRATLICSDVMSDARVSGRSKGDITLVYVKVP